MREKYPFPRRRYRKPDPLINDHQRLQRTLQITSRHNKRIKEIKATTHINRRSCYVHNTPKQQTWP